MARLEHWGVAVTAVIRRRGKAADKKPDTGEKDTNDGVTKTSRSSSGAVRLALLAVAVLVAGSGTAALAKKKSDDDSLDKTRTEGLAAATSYGKDLLSYGYQTVDFDVKKARAEMTPDMARSYDQYWSMLKPSVLKTQAQVLTQVQTAGVSSVSPGKIAVLLYVKQISVNSAHKQPTVGASWLTLNLRKVHGKWLIDGPRMTAPQPPQPTPAPTG